MTIERPVWIWTYWLPSGALVLLVGRQGAGKTTWAWYLVANLSIGRALPGDTRRPALRCGILSLEEPAGRVVARLKAAGADLQRVRVFGSVIDHDNEGRPFERPWQLPKDCDALAAEIANETLSLVVIDGLGYAIAGDSHNYAVVGSALAGLAKVAERTGCTILGLTHPPKGSSDPTTAAIGSTAWTAIPRVVTVLGRDPVDESRRVVRVSKTNFIDPDIAWSWSIAGDDETEAGYVTQIAQSDVAAEALTAGPPSPEDSSALSEAKDWLTDYLTSGGQPAQKTIDDGKAAGHSEKTLRRAKTDLKVKSEKPGGGEWLWLLPTPKQHGRRAGQHGQPPDSGHVGHVGHVAFDQDFFGDQDGQGLEDCQGGQGGQGEDSGHVAPWPADDIGAVPPSGALAYLDFGRVEACRICHTTTVCADDDGPLCKACWQAS